MVYLVGEKEKELLCTVKYERLPFFCYLCGLIRHQTYECEKFIQGLSKVDHQYENWLWVQLGQQNQGSSPWQNGTEFLENKEG